MPKHPQLVRPYFGCSSAVVEKGSRELVIIMPDRKIVRRVCSTLLAASCFVPWISWKSAVKNSGQAVKVTISDTTHHNCTRSSICILHRQCMDRGLKRARTPCLCLGGLYDISSWCCMRRSAHVRVLAGPGYTFGRIESQKHATSTYFGRKIWICLSSRRHTPTYPADCRANLV